MQKHEKCQGRTLGFPSPILGFCIHQGSSNHYCHLLKFSNGKFYIQRNAQILYEHLLNFEKYTHLYNPSTYQDVPSFSENLMPKSSFLPLVLESWNLRAILQFSIFFT